MLFSKEVAERHRAEEKAQSLLLTFGKDRAEEGGGSNGSTEKGGCEGCAGSQNSEEEDPVHDACRSAVALFFTLTTTSSRPSSIDHRPQKPAEIHADDDGNAQRATRARRNGAAQRAALRARLRGFV